MRKDKITVKTQGKISMIVISDITHITCDGYLSTIHTISENRINVSKLLKEFEKELAECSFIRVNHCTLVNFNHITAIKLDKNRTLSLTDNTNIIISRRKWRFVAEFMKKR